MSSLRSQCPLQTVLTDIVLDEYQYQYHVSFAAKYWELYTSMLSWDKGWDLLFERPSNAQSRSMLAIITAIVFRNGYYKTL